MRLHPLKTVFYHCCNFRMEISHWVRYTHAERVQMNDEQMLIAILGRKKWSCLYTKQSLVLQMTIIIIKIRYFAQTNWCVCVLACMCARVLVCLSSQRWASLTLFCSSRWVCLVDLYSIQPVAICIRIWWFKYLRCVDCIWVEPLQSILNSIVLLHK